MLKNPIGTHLKTRRIAIVGAGIAGLSCAASLRAAGHDVTVYEKSRGVGGRICTRWTDDWECDHGAPYFTARDPAFIAQVTQWEAKGLVARWNPAIAVYQNSEWLAAPPLIDRYVGISRMNSPLKALADNLTVRTECHIDRIAFQENKWTLWSIENGAITDQYDALVLALPAPQASQLIQSIDTPLNALADSAEMQGCWTMMLNFADKLDVPFDAAFINQGKLSWIANNSSKPQRSGLSTWLVHANTAWSQQHIDADSADVAEQLVDAFVELTDARPIAHSIHRWRYASTANQLNADYGLDHDSHLGLCGDWLNGGRVEGGWLSGFKLAQKLVQG